MTIQGRISSGKTTFLTYIALFNIRLGARVIHSENKLKIISPTNRIIAKSILPELAAPHLASNTTLKI